MATKADIESTIGWWREAGVDTIVADEPQSWLAQAPRTPARPAAIIPPAPAAAPLPAELTEFRAWMLSGDLVSAPQGERVDASGDPASGLMLLVDMPETGDAGTGHLVSGEAGRLLDRMLAAIGRDRASVYLAAMSPARLPGGAIDESAFEPLAAAARHHVALAAPKWLLLMGDAPSRCFCGANLAQARGMKRIINHDGGTVTAIATFHPRFLLRQPGLKGDSWKDLRMLIEGMTA